MSIQRSSTKACASRPASITLPDGKRQDLDEPNTEKDPHQFANEADHFSKCVLQNQQPQSPGEEGLTDMKLIRQIYKSAGITMA